MQYLGRRRQLFDPLARKALALRHLAEKMQRRVFLRLPLSTANAGCRSISSSVVSPPLRITLAIRIARFGDGTNITAVGSHIVPAPSSGNTMREDIIGPRYAIRLRHVLKITCLQCRHESIVSPAPPVRRFGEHAFLNRLEDIFRSRGRSVTRKGLVDPQGTTSESPTVISGGASAGFPSGGVSPRRRLAPQPVRRVARGPGSSA